MLVVGESARAENFGILGYNRDTTPKLDKEAGLIAFTDVHSCGTETAVSVPCMFSNMGRKDYDASKAKNEEGLLDVLKRAGIDVIWRDNQSGCKGTCDRVTLQDVSNLKDPALCANSECRDEILLQGLQGFIEHLDKDTVLVLHQMGSHGPEYFKRYPKEYEHFTPVCESNALNNCSRESIVNGYDNTLVYTDHVLSSLIDVLRSNQDKVDTAMLYLSDHGESLGEYNLFLHGTPYMLAPEQQKHVAMLAWFSDNYQKAYSVDTHCLQMNRDKPLSQDNLFHSMLGLLEVKSTVYQTRSGYVRRLPWRGDRRRAGQGLRRVAAPSSLRHLLQIQACRFSLSDYSFSLAGHFVTALALRRRVNRRWRYILRAILQGRAVWPSIFTGFATTKASRSFAPSGSSCRSLPSTPNSCGSTPSTRLPVCCRSVTANAPT